MISTKQNLLPLLMIVLLGTISNRVNGQAFSCPEIGYLFQSSQSSPTVVYSVDLASGNYNTVHSNLIADRVNGVGYDPVNGYIWGYNIDQNQVVKVDASFNVTSYTVSGLPAQAYWVGDVSTSGIYHLLSGSTMYKVDVTGASPSYVGSTAVSPGGTVLDWAFNPIDNQLYTVTQSANNLLRIDPNTGTVTNLGAPSVLSGETTKWGAVYFDVTGDFYISGNTTGDIFRFPNVQNLSAGGTPAASHFADGPSSSGNDGTKCPYSDVSPEACANSVDDDGDTDVDCDDSDCETNSACIVGGGGGGGLESNDRLAEKIAYREFWRRKYDVDLEDRNSMPKAYRTDLYGKKRTGFFRNDFSIRSFIPIDVIPNTETFISSPKDLSLLSNAVEVMSVDSYQGERRVGTVLGLKSENGVYEHTKYICDRVKGGKLRDIRYHKLDGVHDFAVSRVSNAEGGHELVSLISVYLNQQGAFELESHWSIDQYPDEHTYYNFQIWANSFSKLEYLATEVLRLLQIQAPIAHYHISDYPDVYISELGYENGHLRLIVSNPIGASELALDLTKRSTETADPEPFSRELKLTGALQDTLLVATDGIFTVGGKVKNDLSEVPDDIYVGGGAWGYFGTEHGYTIDDYQVTIGDHQKYGEEASWIERNVMLKGKLKDEISIFRTLRAATKPVNYTGYNTLTFEVKGTGNLEVVLAKASIENWAEQPRVSFNIDGQCQQIYLNILDFEQDAGRFAWSDIESISFIQRGDGVEEKPFELEIRNVAFVNLNETPECGSFNRQQLRAFPNPMRHELSIYLSGATRQDYELVFSNHLGQIITTASGVSDDEGRIDFRNSNLIPGMYYYTVYVESGSYSGKVLVN